MTANAPLISTVPFFSCSSLALNARLHYTMAHRASSDLELEGSGLPAPHSTPEIQTLQSFGIPSLVKIDTIFHISPAAKLLEYSVIYSTSLSTPHLVLCQRIASGTFLSVAPPLQTFSCPIFQQAGQPRPYPLIHFMTPSYLPTPI